ncbi:MAG TPA: hypothetical protein VMD59_12485 [Acidimicrobiales bacterium]|nr:hypothetical protein [Acidimicrobiales bacterium]
MSEPEADTVPAGSPPPAQAQASPGPELEAPRALSQSMLWRLHDEYFARSGIRAWSSGDVPHLLTNSPMVSRAYAEVIEGVLDDCAAGRFGPVDPSEPLYVVELGAGIGRLAYNLLHVLAEPGDAPPVVYVLTDAFEPNLDFWRHNPRLAPLVEAGRLDFARYGVGNGEPLVLEQSGRTLEPGSLANPLVVVANYLFDVLRQDLYRIVPAEDAAESRTEPGEGDGGRRRALREELVGVLAPANGEETGSPEFFRQLFLRTELVEVTPGRYEDGELQEILEEVALERAPDGPSRFLYPVAALQGVRDLLELAGSRLVLILGERPGEVGQPGDERAVPAPAGPAGAEAGAGGEAPPTAHRPGHLLAMGVHGGSISLPVDLDILGRVVRRRGGELLLPEASPAGLLVGACIAGDGGSARSTRRRFRLAVDEGGPEDLFLSLRAMLDRGVEDIPLSMALALLRVGGYDAFLFRQIHERLAAVLPEADPAGKEEAARVMREVWERFYPIDDRTDLAFGIAALLAPAGRIVEALEFLGYSHDHAPTALGSYNTALCHLLLADEHAAWDAVDEALALEPEHELALQLKQKMEDAGTERRSVSR